ncbi:hypothetical protein B0H13DRAFT_2127755 [Mycena leptocephala]|nr:hypothetical protein B0H13DRAFT_2127755 [Mycena leptocephala]
MTTTQQKATASERAAHRGRIADIGVQILELERSIRSLQNEKAVLQDRLDAYVYPVLTLPAEIVSEIFAHCVPVYPKCPPVTGLLSPTKLAQICRIWREIAFSTMTLWRAVGVYEPIARQSNLGAEFHALETSLTRCGSFPLSIEMEFGDPKQQGLPAFYRIIAAHRVEHLKLFGPLGSLRYIERPLLSLHSLTIGFSVGRDGVGDAPSTFLAAPLLRKVAFQIYHDVFHYILPWTQLTVLIVGFIAPHECALLLNLATSLVHCGLTLSSSHALSLAPVVPLLHLQILVLQSYQEYYDGRGLLNTLTLPALRSLRVKEELLYPNPVATLRSLILRSGCALEKVHIFTPTATVDPCKPYQRALSMVAFSFGPPRAIGLLFFQRSDGSGERDAADDWDDELGL